MQCRTESIYSLLSVSNFFHSKANIIFFQVLLSSFIMPFSLYLSLIYWVYPLKDIFGETGCYIMTCLRNMGTFMIQLQSFFMATFRYICLFHDDFLIRFSLSPMVSISVNSSRIVSKEIILFWICNM